MFVSRVGHQPMRPDVTVIPERAVGVRQVIRGGMDRVVFGQTTPHPPSSLKPRTRPACAAAASLCRCPMRHLIEAVGRCDRANHTGLNSRSYRGSCSGIFAGMFHWISANLGLLGHCGFPVFSKGPEIGHSEMIGEYTRQIGADLRLGRFTGKIIGIH